MKRKLLQLKDEEAETIARNDLEDKVIPSRWRKVIVDSSMQTARGFGLQISMAGFCFAR